MKLSELVDNNSWEILPLGVPSKTNLERNVRELLKKYEPQPTEEDMAELTDRLNDFQKRVDKNNWQN